MPNRSRLPSRSALGAAIVSLVALLATCAKEREPRSFVQPNAIKRSDLEGTWYYVQTVTDSPPSNGAAFVGVSSDLMKIKFDVQENTLYARRAYEQINNSEDAKARDAKGYLGQPLAAWRIEGHFDVIRDYNATTGEETNKIIESQERPWTQREFLRVDWSKNLITDYSGIGLQLWFSDAKVEPVSYWESDPSHPDAIHFERATKEEEEFTANEMNYFDLTNKLVLTPQEFLWCADGAGGSACQKFPACFLQQGLEDCAAAVVKVRHAFSKLSPKHDYQPRKWDGKQMELFGLWDVGLNRLKYNREYGVTNTDITRHAARFNLWKRSYENGKEIPYAKRELKTIPYYAGSTTGTFPADLWGEGQKVIDEWNAALSTAVKNVTGKMPDKRVFVWCHNPVKLAMDAEGPADPPECKANLKPELDANGKEKRDAKGNLVYRARQGDPRRSTIFWVNQFQAAGPLGYGPPLYDVETGETLSGQSYIYGAGLDTLAARARDLVLLVSGRIPQDQYIQGVNVSEWVARNQSGTTTMPKTYSDLDVAERTGAMDFTWARNLAPHAKLAPLDKSSLKAFRASLDARQKAIAKTGIFGRGQGDVAQVRRDKLRGTPIEAMLVTPDLLRSAPAKGPGGASWASLSDAEKARLSPLRSTAVRKAIEERKERLMALGVDFADFAEEGIAQRAMQLAQNPETRSMDAEAIRKLIRKDLFLAVTLHEMGHNVGLRHNFRASWDSINYHPKYWELRHKGLGSTQKFAGLDRRTLEPVGVPFGGSDCGGSKRGKLRPRYADCPGGAISVEEAKGGVAEYQYSSVMDYGSEFNSDLMGLGHYDKAAMKFAYAGDGYVEVWKRTKKDDASLNKLASLQFFSGSYGFPSPIVQVEGRDGEGVLQGMAYTSYPELFENGWQGIYEREDVPFSEVLANHAETSLYFDKQERLMVPYYFCGDEFVGNLTCQRWDAGADAFEQANDAISRYHNHYLLNNFKRDRYTFQASMGYLARISQRYLAPLHAQTTWYVLFRAIFGDEPGLWDEKGWGNFPVAVAEGFDLLGRIITQPEPGTYVKVTADDSPDARIEHWKQASETPMGTSSDKQTVIPLLDGKHITTTWDFDRCGYYWSDECLSRIGYLFDKIAALDVLTQTQANFTGRDTSTDIRFYSMGYYLPFKKQIEEKFGALLADDFQSFAPYMDAAGAKLMTPSWAQNNPATAKPRIIDPAAGFTTQLYAALYGLSGFPASFDQSFVESSRIFVVGNGEAPVPDAALMPTLGTAGAEATYNPAELVSADKPGPKGWILWRDKTSGKTYAAKARPRTTHEGGTTPYRTDIGARMLENAANLEKMADAACAGGASSSCTYRTRILENFRDNIEIMRMLHKMLGN